MTSATDPLVWLPFEPEVLGELPDNLRYEHIDPDDLPPAPTRWSSTCCPTGSGPPTASCWHGCRG